MTRNVLPFLFLYLSFAAFSQTDGKTTTSQSYLPLACLSEKIYIEKYEPITPYEIAQAITNRENSSDKDSTRGKTQIIEGANFFNLILYRKINNHIDQLTDETNDTLINTVHSRDRKENIDGNYQYLILSDFNFTAFDEKSKIREGYYIYDQTNDTKYNTYPSVESLLRALKMARKKSTKMNQFELNMYLRPYNERDYASARTVKTKMNVSSVIYFLVMTTLITLVSIF